MSNLNQSLTYEGVSGDLRIAYGDDPLDRGDHPPALGKITVAGLHFGGAAQQAAKLARQLAPLKVLDLVSGDQSGSPIKGDPVAFGEKYSGNSEANGGYTTICSTSGTDRKLRSKTSPSACLGHAVRTPFYRRR